MTPMAPVLISVFVRGRPVPKGSMIVRHLHGHGTPGARSCSCRQWPVEQADTRLTEWRALIATAVKAALGTTPPYEGPIATRLTFFFARPKSHKGPQLLTPWCYNRDAGDIEKLVRAVHDAINDCAGWRDDCQVARVVAEKRYCDGLEQPGVQITLEALASG